MSMQQKLGLQTRLSQRLILTPSLQQAIKLLPMTTLELAEMLNQEMVENPMLEEVPTEDLQPAEAAQAEKPAVEQQANKTDTWDDQDYEYFFGDYLDDELELRERALLEGHLATCPTCPGLYASIEVVGTQGPTSHHDPAAFLLQARLDARVAGADEDAAGAVGTLLLVGQGSLFGGKSAISSANRRPPRTSSRVSR